MGDIREQTGRCLWITSSHPPCLPSSARAAAVSVWREEREQCPALLCMEPQGCWLGEWVCDSPGQAGTLSSPLLHPARSWGLHLSTVDTSEHGAQGRGQGGLRGRDQELWSCQKIASRAALEQAVPKTSG